MHVILSQHLSKALRNVLLAMLVKIFSHWFRKPSKASKLTPSRTLHHPEPLLPDPWRQTPKSRIPQVGIRGIQLAIFEQPPASIERGVGAGGK
jgi:hypothetical protein